MDLMLQPLRKYADFNGRARRSEYWLFVLFKCLLLIGYFFVSAILTGVIAAITGDGAAANVISSLLAIAFVIGFLALIIPTFAVLVRRFHDCGYTGWLVLTGLIPLIGGLIVFVFTVLDGTRGPNEFGPDPKGSESGPQQPLDLAETFS